MNEIKSETAECLLNAAKQSNVNGCPVSLGVATKAVIIAEQEAEERHAKELQELRDKAVEAVNTALCYYGCSKGEYCQEPCERRDLIIQKLNKK